MKQPWKGAWKCVQCGCTDEYGCDGGCAWVAPNLCSECVLAGRTAGSLSYHVARAQSANAPPLPTLAMCGARITVTLVTARSVPIEDRCARQGCRQHWPRHSERARSAGGAR